MHESYLETHHCELLWNAVYDGPKMRDLFSLRTTELVHYGPSLALKARRVVSSTVSLSMLAVGAIAVPVHHHLCIHWQMKITETQRVLSNVTWSTALRCFEGA